MNPHELTDSLQKVLLKKALGYDVCESSEEFAVGADDEKIKKTKVKITNKHCPPDLNALKILLDLQNRASAEVADMTDEQLEEEKLRLISLLRQTEESDDRQMQ